MTVPPVAPAQIAVPPQQPIPAHDLVDDGDDPGDPLPPKPRRARPIDENHPQVKRLLRQQLDAQLAEFTTKQQRQKLEETERLKAELADSVAKSIAHQEAVEASQRRYTLLQAIVTSGHRLQPNAAQFVEFQVTGKMQSEGLQAQDALNAVLNENPYLLVAQLPIAQQQVAVPGQVPQVSQAQPAQAPMAPQAPVASVQPTPPVQVQAAPVYQAPAPAQVAPAQQWTVQQAAAAGVQGQSGVGVPQQVQVVPYVSTTPRQAPATQTPVPAGQPQVVDARKMSPQAFAAYTANKYGV